jgi:hypothetical protein
MGNPGARFIKVAAYDDVHVVELEDVDTFSVPQARHPRLLYVTPMDRDDWQVASGAFVIHWPRIDNDLGVDRLLRGAGPPRVPVMNSQHGHAPGRSLQNHDSHEHSCHQAF